jgi:hypothetical protein
MLTSLKLDGTFKDDHLVEMIRLRLRQPSDVEMKTEAVDLQHVFLEYKGRRMDESAREKIGELVRTGVVNVCIREDVQMA